MLSIFWTTKAKCCLFIRCANVKTNMLRDRVVKWTFHHCKYSWTHAAFPAVSICQGYNLPTIRENYCDIFDSGTFLHTFEQKSVIRLKAKSLIVTPVKTGFFEAVTCSQDWKSVRGTEYEDCSKIKLRLRDVCFRAVPQKLLSLLVSSNRNKSCWGTDCSAATAVLSRCRWPYALSTSKISWRSLFILLFCLLTGSRYCKRKWDFDQS